jgi:hypothetical protein
MEMPWKQPQGAAPTETTRVRASMAMPWKQPQGVAPTETA